MTTALIDGGTVAATTKRAEPSLAENPRTRRFGINPALLNLEVHPRESGRQESVIPYGIVCRFETFVGMHTHNWSVDPFDQSEAYVETDLTAKEAIENVKRVAFESSRDMGFRELAALTPISDTAAAHVVTDIFPSLEEVGRACPQGEERCLTCTLDWLESDECAERAERSPAHKELRDQLLDAYLANERFFKTKWREWTAELQKRERGENGLSVLGDAHLHVMRQLHEIHPDERQSEAIRSTQEAQANAISSGLKEVVSELVRNNQQQQPAVDVSALREELKAELLAELRAGEKAEQKTPRSK